MRNGWFGGLSRWLDVHFIFTIPHSCLDTLSRSRSLHTRQRKCFYAIAGAACWTQVRQATMLPRYRWAGLVGVLLFWLVCWPSWLCLRVTL